MIDFSSKRRKIHCAQALYPKKMKALLGNSSQVVLDNLK